MSDSLSISHVSEVDSCSGIRSFEIKKALEINVPQRMPQVSRFRLVFEEAINKKRLRRSGEIKIVRSGVPFSR